MDFYFIKFNKIKRYLYKYIIIFYVTCFELFVISSRIDNHNLKHYYMH